MKDYLVPFIIAFMVFCAGFLALDGGIMSLQGLSLFYSP